MSSTILHRLSSFGALALTALFLAAPSSPVFAQRGRRPVPPAPVEVSPAELEYRATITAGLAEYDAHRYPEASVLFRRAHAMMPNARTLRGIGMCEFEMRDYVGAVIHLGEALVHESRPLDEVQRADVTRLLEQANTFVGRLALTVHPADAVVTIDGAAPVVRDAHMLVNAGDHELLVESTGMIATVRRIHVSSGETVTLEITLAPPASLARDVTPPEPPRIRPHPVRLPSAIAYGIGGAGLVLFVGAGIPALGLERDHTDGCLARGECTADSLEKQDRLAHLADAGLVLAVAGTATGLLLQLLHTEPGSETTPTVSAVVDRNTTMVVVGGAF